MPEVDFLLDGKGMGGVPVVLQTWLLSIGVDSERLSIHCCVQLPLDLAQGVWEKVMDRYGGNENKARALLKSKVWYWEDLQLCEQHWMVNCACKLCHTDKLCDHPGCDKLACFSYGTKPGIKCRMHRMLRMVDAEHCLCDHPGSTSRPYYNLPGITPPVCCIQHKTAGMEAVYEYRCVVAFGRLLRT